jgi:MbtH protein
VKQPGNLADNDDNETKFPYVVLINNAEQHSLWRADLQIPSGWRRVFGPADKTDCLSYVNEHWTDMRPLSLRPAIEAASRSAAPE